MECRTTNEADIITRECRAIGLWLEANGLVAPILPPSEREVELFAAVLGDSLSSDDEVMAALIALAHAEGSRAASVLHAYAQAPHPGFDELAHLACDEHRFWSGRQHPARFVA